MRRINRTTCRPWAGDFTATAPEAPKHVPRRLSIVTVPHRSKREHGLRGNDNVSEGRAPQSMPPAGPVILRRRSASTKLRVSSTERLPEHPPAGREEPAAPLSASLMKRPSQPKVAGSLLPPPRPVRSAPTADFPLLCGHWWRLKALVDRPPPPEMQRINTSCADAVSLPTGFWRSFASAASAFQIPPRAPAIEPPH